MLIFTAFEHINSHAEKGALLKDDNEMNKVRNYQKELEKIIDILFVNECIWFNLKYMLIKPSVTILPNIYT